MLKKKKTKKVQYFIIFLSIKNNKSTKHQECMISTPKNVLAKIFLKKKVHQKNSNPKKVPSSEISSYLKKVFPPPCHEYT